MGQFPIWEIRCVALRHTALKQTRENDDDSAATPVNTECPPAAPTTLLQAVLGEVGWYVAVLLLLMWGFACAFFTIFKEDGAAEDSFASLPLALLTMLNYAVGWERSRGRGGKGRGTPRILDAEKPEQKTLRAIRRGLKSQF